MRKYIDMIEDHYDDDEDFIDVKAVCDRFHGLYEATSGADMVANEPETRHRRRIVRALSPINVDMTQGQTLSGDADITDDDDTAD